MHSSNNTVDEDDYIQVRCTCGEELGLVPDNETATDVLMDHAIAVGFALGEAKSGPSIPHVTAVSVERCLRWHNGRFYSEDRVNDGTDWTGADWSNAMCGEAGEAANVVKKLRRIETGTGSAANPIWSELLADLAIECADVFLYLVLLCAYYHLDLEKAVIEKFNAVSEREGFPERL